MPGDRMMEQTDSIIALNRDVEPFVIQASATRSEFFKSKFNDPFKPLTFVHLSDVHFVLEAWNRMVEYVNHYHEFIQFAIHTGDYCGNSQAVYSDCYGEGDPCVRPILNCVGNHDTIKTKFETERQPKETTHALLFNHTEDWNVTFLDCPHSMSYHKDFDDSNVRLIVLDLYYDLELQQKWLQELLDEAKEKGLCVITAMHQPTAEVRDTYGVTFHTPNDYETLCGAHAPIVFEAQIAKFIQSGGCHVCNLAGHLHHDRFGLTDAGVLNVCVPCATNWEKWCDGKRVKGTRTFDCFNVVSIDANLGHLKLVRIGDNVDHHLRVKRALCFDYKNRRVISNS